MKIGDRLEMLSIAREGQPLHPALLWDDTEQILVDAGLPLQYELLAAAAQQAGRDITNATRLIFTHQDMDHIGSGREIKAAAPGLTVLAHQEEAPYINGSQTPIKLAARMASLETGGSEEDKANVPRMLEAYRSRTVAIDQPLVGGEVLPWCGGIKVFHTPGHTPGHICLYIQNCGVLIAGDALNAENGKLKGPNPIHTKDMVQARQSLALLLDYDILGVLCYHGGYVEGNIRAQLEALIHER